MSESVATESVAHEAKEAPESKSVTKRILTQEEAVASVSPKRARVHSDAEDAEDETGDDDVAEHDVEEDAEDLEDESDDETPGTCSACHEACNPSSQCCSRCLRSGNVALASV